VLEHLAGGMAPEETLPEFRYLTRGDIRACLPLAADYEHKLEISRVKLLFDENLFPRLAGLRADVYRVRRMSMAADWEARRASTFCNFSVVF
jgi:hypothetical protein